MSLSGSRQQLTRASVAWSKSRICLEKYAKFFFFFLAGLPALSNMELEAGFSLIDYGSSAGLESLCCNQEPPSHSGPRGSQTLALPTLPRSIFSCLGSMASPFLLAVPLLDGRKGHRTRKPILYPNPRVGSSGFLNGRQSTPLIPSSACMGLRPRRLLLAQLSLDLWVI